MNAAGSRGKSQPGMRHNILQRVKMMITSAINGYKCMKKIHVMLHGPPDVLNDSNRDTVCKSH